MNWIVVIFPVRTFVRKALLVRVFFCEGNSSTSIIFNRNTFKTCTPLSINTENILKVMLPNESEAGHGLIVDNEIDVSNEKDIVEVECDYCQSMKRVWSATM